MEDELLWSTARHRSPASAASIARAPTARARPAGAEAVPEARGKEWLGALGSARTRIAASILLLLVISSAASLIAIRQVLLLRLDNRVDQALRQETEEFGRLVAEGRDPTTGRPFESVAALFDVYLARNVPGNSEAFFAFVNGRVWDQRVRNFPLDRIRPTVHYAWTAASTDEAPTRVEYETFGAYESPLGRVRYRVVPVRYNGDPGAFVVAIVPAAELSEIRELQTWGTGIALVVLLMVGASTWFVAGRALRPVKQLTATAQAISESDLTSRIEVRGSGEAAEMAHSFNSMLDRLETLFGTERDFARDAGHALRDPLTICLGYMEQLDSADPAEQREMRRVVMDELGRMGRIVNDLERLAQAERADFLAIEAIDLELFAHELVAKASALAGRRWILEGAARGTLMGDRHRLTEAVMNLAHNAVAHTEEGDVIAVGVARTSDRVRIWVRDRGVGVAAADRDRIFERLTRGEGSRRRYRGNGLGLTIVKAVAEAHGGHVELDSREGKGAMFTMVLPVGEGREEST